MALLLSNVGSRHERIWRTHRFDVRLILGVHLVQHHDKSDAASECLAIDGTGHVLEGLKRKRTLCPCSTANRICRRKVLARRAHSLFVRVGGVCATAIEKRRTARRAHLVVVDGVEES